VTSVPKKFFLDADYTDKVDKFSSEIGLLISEVPVPKKSWSLLSDSDSVVRRPCLPYFANQIKYSIMALEIQEMGEDNEA